MKTKEEKKIKNSGYVPYMGTLSEEQIRKGTEKFLAEIKSTVAHLEEKKSSYQLSN